MTFQNCTLTESLRIGLVEKSGQDEANALLENIFDEIAAMYKANNPQPDPHQAYNEMSGVVFSTTEELETYVNRRHYYEERLCFALDWEEFDPEESIFKLQIRYNMGDVPDTRLPQNEYEEATYN